MNQSKEQQLPEKKKESKLTTQTAKGLSRLFALSVLVHLNLGFLKWLILGMGSDEATAFAIMLGAVSVPLGVIFGSVSAGVGIKNYAKEKFKAGLSID